MVVIGLVFLGFLSSMYGTIIGAGGAFLFVPTLLFFSDISPEVAAATGLTIVFLNAISGLPILIKQRRISIRIGLFLSAGAFPGAYLGHWLVKYSPVEVFYTLFSCLLIGLGLFLIMKKPKPSNTKAEVAATIENLSSSIQSSEPKKHIIKYWKVFSLGVLIGVISSFFGIGGGWLLVPILVYGFKFTMKNATATSIFSLALYSLFGMLLTINDSSIDWSIVVWSGIGVLIGAQVGAILSKKMKDTTISRLLASVVIMMGVVMFFQL
jgi:uncharacterized protein